MTLPPCKEVMTKNLITVHEHEILDTVVSYFSSHNIHHLPVLNSDAKLVGIISQTDIERLKMSASIFKFNTEDDYNKALFECLIAKSVMTKNVVHVGPNDKIDVAYAIFKKNKIHALPVVEESTLIGIITPLDLLNFFFLN